MMCVTGAFRNTGYNRLLTELGWDTLDHRRKLSRLCLFKKMQVSKLASSNNNPQNVLVQPYLYNLLPGTVGDRAGYVLRNASKVDNVKTRLVVSYNSFIPKTIRDWNALFIEYWHVEQAGNNIQNASSNIPILPEAFLTFGSKSSVGPSNAANGSYTACLVQ